jgi:hypothetical protein
MPHTEHVSGLAAVLRPSLGLHRMNTLLDAVELPGSVVRPAGPTVSRAEVAFALALVLFEELTRRVPMAEAYLRDLVRSGRRMVFDHGAVRTVAAPCGELPGGRVAFTRILEPLGYVENGLYPLAGLGMTGRSYAHEDAPEDVPQYFVSELHPERFSPGFQEAVQRVVSSSRDPLSQLALASLQQIAIHRELPVETAALLIPELVSCFKRLHDEPTLNDYDLLRSESPEMAWIATEGHAFNHGTDRVGDVRAVAEQQRLVGRPIKDTVEVSQSGRVVQTAFRAAEVERLFVGIDGHLVARRVPGSFHEFITRQRLDDGSLDLAFDANNAQGIFQMTSGR